MDYLMRFQSIFLVTLTLDFQYQIGNMIYISAKNGPIATKQKQTYHLNSRPQMWPLDLTLNFQGQIQNLLYRCVSGKLWYLQHYCVGDTIVYH